MQFIKSFSFGNLVIFNQFRCSLENTIPDVFADSEVHSNFILHK